VSISRSLPWKVASGLGAISVAAVLFTSGASASPAPSLPAGQSASHLAGASGATTGGLVPASRAVTAYWNAHASVAKQLSAPVTSASPTAKAFQTTQQRPSVPQGPAGKVAGAVGTITSTRAMTPALGPNGSPWWGSSTSAPATTTGKVFFTDHKGGNWVCSGSLVNSPAQNVVITAGHCVYGTAGGELPAGETWHSNWVFGP
jgi:hypothetical protein